MIYYVVRTFNGAALVALQGVIAIGLLGTLTSSLCLGCSNNMHTSSRLVHAE